MNLLLSLIPLIVSAPSAAQPAQPDDVEVRVSGEALLHTNPMRDVRTLAIDIGPRLTGTPACDRTEAWIEQQLRDAGLSDVHREGYDLAYSWVPGDFEVRAPEPLEAAPLGWSGATPPEGV